MNGRQHTIFDCRTLNRGQFVQNEFNPDVAGGKGIVVWKTEQTWYQPDAVIWKIDMKVGAIIFCGETVSMVDIDQTILR